MKKIFFALIFLTLIFTACAPETSTPAPSPIPSPLPQIRPTVTNIPVNLTPAQQAAVTALSRTLSLPPEKIALVSSEAVTWPDGCLGVQKIGMMCAQNQVSGFRIVLSANGTQYEFHTNQDGSTLQPVEGVQVAGPAQDAMIKQLAANLGLQSSDIRVISAANVIWNDTCMGVEINGTACTQKDIPGYLFVLEANGHQYEYHTNDTGSRSVPGTVALTWTLSGGSTNLCESLNIFASGEVYGYTCQPKPDGRMGLLMKLVTAGELKQFQGWLDTYKPMDLDLSDPTTTANAMTRGIDLFGLGDQQPKTEDMQTIYDWAQKVFEALYK
jgi:hypothetical protein